MSATKPGDRVRVNVTATVKPDGWAQIDGGGYLAPWLIDRHATAEEPSWANTEGAVCRGLGHLSDVTWVRWRDGWVSASRKGFGVEHPITYAELLERVQSSLTLLYDPSAES